MTLDHYVFAVSFETREIALSFLPEMIMKAHPDFIEWLGSLPPWQTMQAGKLHDHACALYFEYHDFHYEGELWQVARLIAYAKEAGGFAADMWVDDQKETKYHEYEPEGDHPWGDMVSNAFGPYIDINACGIEATTKSLSETLKEEAG